MKRFDERNTMFARMAYKPGSKEYIDYYQCCPEKKAVDDKLRELPGLTAKKTPTYDRLDSPLARSTFNFLADIKKYASGPAKNSQTEVKPEVITKKLKQLARSYGADLVGATRLEPDDYYSHQGREPESYGDEVTETYNYAFVFAVEMEEERINKAPEIEQMLETTKGYVEAGLVGMIISYYLRELGYKARNNMDGNYLLPVVFAASKAGLGEIGRSGMLITEEYGPRVRLGVVTTELELATEESPDQGLKEYCKVCVKCADRCPGDAIPKGNPTDLNGFQVWRRDEEACYEIWQRVGTDCGICIAACPQS